MKKKLMVSFLLAVSMSMIACGKEKPDKSQRNDTPDVIRQEESLTDRIDDENMDQNVDEEDISSSTALEETDAGSERATIDTQTASESELIDTETESETEPAISVVNWDESWQYADHSILHSDSVTLYRATAGERKNVVVTVNAGHGTVGGTSVKTLCHPDGSAKVTGGSTAEGSLKAAAVSSGTTMLDGTPEAKVTLSLAMLVKDTLLNNGYDVLMIRESDDVQLDNVARTVYANNNSDCHIALHYNSTDYDAGFFYIGVPDIASYKAMEPVASHWQEHNAFGAALLEGMKETNVKVSGDGFLGMDLTQTSYSTVPSTDVEVGDRGSDYSQEVQQQIADGILAGLDIWCEQR